MYNKNSCSCLQYFSGLVKMDCDISRYKKAKQILIHQTTFLTKMADNSSRNAAYFASSEFLKLSENKSL